MKIKRKLAVLMALFIALCSGCEFTPEQVDWNQEEEQKEAVVLEVITTFAGNDGGAQTFQHACRDWAGQTGNTLVDMSSISDETFKTRVITDFETGSEPDVLFFFNGADANNFIQSGKVVPLDEIRESYPDFCDNLNIDKIPTSLVDDRIYAIPVNGYWEALFVNTHVLHEAGVELPGADYTWDQFLEDCEQIREAGFTPIAASLGSIPHYWWEYAIFNRSPKEEHQVIPQSVDEDLGMSWVDAMNDIKQLYDCGYFPWNTNYASDEQTFSMFMDGRAAFLLDGSWKVGSIVQACQQEPDNPYTLDETKLQQFDIVYFPTMGNREATDLIGGMSMGYYITRSAWEDPEKREAAVSFVSYMTSDEIAPRFAEYTVDVLKTRGDESGMQYNSLQQKAMELLNNSTSMTGAVQDMFQGRCRESTFDRMPDIMTDKITAYDAVKEGLEIYHTQ